MHPETLAAPLSPQEVAEQIRAMEMQFPVAEQQPQPFEPEPRIDAESTRQEAGNPIGVRTSHEACGPDCPEHGAGLQLNESPTCCDDPSHHHHGHEHNHGDEHDEHHSEQADQHSNHKSEHPEGSQHAEHGEKPRAALKENSARCDDPSHHHGASHHEAHDEAAKPHLRETAKAVCPDCGGEGVHHHSHDELRSEQPPQEHKAHAEHAKEHSGGAAEVTRTHIEAERQPSTYHEVAERLRTAAAEMEEARRRSSKIEVDTTAEQYAEPIVAVAVDAEARRAARTATLEQDVTADGASTVIAMEREVVAGAQENAVSKFHAAEAVLHFASVSEGEPLEDQEQSAEVMPGLQSFAIPG